MASSPHTVSGSRTRDYGSVRTLCPLQLIPAGIAFQDGDGRQADVHALRYTLCTNLARGGVAVQTAMAVMRHCDIKLTPKVYLDGGQPPNTDAMKLVPAFARKTVEERSPGRSLGNGVASHCESLDRTVGIADEAGRASDLAGEIGGKSSDGTECLGDAENSTGRTRTYAKCAGNP
jgi:hypothetical protein